MKASIILVAVFAFSPPIAAQTITDGDTLRMNGVTYRLHGIDAPETKQDCPDGWPAGRMATTRPNPIVAASSDIQPTPDARPTGHRLHSSKEPFAPHACEAVPRF